MKPVRIQRDGKRLNDIFCYIAIRYYHPEIGFGKTLSAARKMLSNDPYCRKTLNDFWIKQEEEWNASNKNTIRD